MYGEDIFSYYKHALGVYDVAVSTRAFGTMAVRTESRLYLSWDDGRTFAPVDPDWAGPPLDVAVGPAGEVWTVHEDGLRVFGADGRHRLVAAPDRPTRGGTGDLQLVVAGGYIGIVDTSSSMDLAASSDEGRSWTLHRLHGFGGPDGYYAEINGINIDSNGTVNYVGKLEEDDGIAVGWHRGRIPDDRWETFSGLPTLSGNGLGLGHDNTIYELSMGSEYDPQRCVPVGERGVCTVDQTGHRSFLIGGADRWRPFSVAHNGRETYAVYGRNLLQLTRTSARIVAWDVPGAARDDEDSAAARDRDFSVDSCDRVVLLDRGRVVRWSEATGWRIVWEPPSKGR